MKKVLGILALIAIIATMAVPQAQAKKKKRDLKKEAIEDLIRDGVTNYEAGNYDEAFPLFEAAHNKGNIRATHNLAICYSEGHGVAQDYAKALKLYEKAAKKGYADSQMALGQLYMGGLGVKKDYKKAIKWFEKAAK